MENRAVCPLYGALGGDLVGSIYEFWNIKTKEFELVADECCLTDDSTLTMATADAILGGKAEYALYYHTWGNRHPNMGYGGRFLSWLQQPFEKAYDYGSWGNGAAMRVSPVGYAFDSVDTVLDQAELTARTTHGHPEGVRGAQATALAVFLARHGKSKDEIQEEITRRFDYDLSTPLDVLRPDYEFDVSCQGTVPVALRAFLQSWCYEDAIRNAVSVGGDSDTIAAITGGVALAYYHEMPARLVTAIEARLQEDMRIVCQEFAKKFPLTEGDNP